MFVFLLGNNSIGKAKQQRAEYFPPDWSSFTSSCYYCASVGRLISSATNTSAQAMSLQERWAWLPRGAAFVRSNDKEDQHYRGQTIKAQSEWYLFVVMVDKIRGLSGSLFILLVGFKKSGIGEGGGRERTVDKQRNRRWTFLRSFRKDGNFYWIAIHLFKLANLESLIGMDWLGFRVSGFVVYLGGSSSLLVLDEVKLKKHHRWLKVGLNSFNHQLVAISLSLELITSGQRTLKPQLIIQVDHNFHFWCN